MNKIIRLVEKIETTAIVRSVREAFVKAALRAKKDKVSKAIIILVHDDGAIGHECAGMTTEERLAVLSSVQFLINRDRFR